MTVATDSDPYFALPKLYGAPAYARPPRVVPESERPFDPDDLPIAAEMTDEERAVTSTLRAPGGYWTATPVGAMPDLAVASVSASASASSAGRSGSGHNGSGGSSAGGSNGHAHAGGGTSAADRRFSIRALTERIGPRPK